MDKPKLIEIPPACLKEKDQLLGFLFVEEIDEFAHALYLDNIRPIGHQACLFRCDNELYVRGVKSYRERVMVYFKAWVRGRHVGISHCQVPIRTPARWKKQLPVRSDT